MTPPAGEPPPAPVTCATCQRQCAPAWHAGEWEFYGGDDEWAWRDGECGPCRQARQERERKQDVSAALAVWWRGMTGNMGTITNGGIQAGAMDPLRQWVSTGPRGLLMLTGGSGSGKTSAALLTARAAAVRGHRPLARFVAAARLLTYKRGDTEAQEAELEDGAAFPGVLILDDFGKQPTTPWARAAAFNLIDQRTALALPTIVTSEHGPASFVPPEHDEGMARRLAMGTTVQLTPPRR